MDNSSQPDSASAVDARTIVARAGDCGHDHGTHDGPHEPGTQSRTRLVRVFALAVVFMLVEIVGGWWSGALSLWADAGHMFSDAAALGLSWFAAWLASRESPPQQTFGYLRAEILATVVNATLLLVVAAVVAWEAASRLREPAHVHGLSMGVIGAIGLAVNLLMLRILHGGHEHDLNVRGAWLHVLGDTLGSIGVVIAAVGAARGLLWLDPAVSLLIGVLISYSAVRLLLAAIDILMERAPAGIDVGAVQSTLAACPGVLGVHCLHIWSISSGFHALSAHVVAAPQSSSDLLHDLHAQLSARFGLRHITLQIEPAGFTDCPVLCGTITCRAARPVDSAERHACETH